MPNTFVHTELNTTDPKKAKDFFGKLFDWKLEDMDMGPGGTYTLIKAGEGMGGGGGIMQHPMPGAPSVWIPYVLVANLAASTSKAKSLGAQIIKENVPVPNMGKFSIIADPTGAVLGLWEAQAK
jgi:predicted enzyme related to lactoylglutathione lyase